METVQVLSHREGSAQLPTVGDDHAVGRLAPRRPHRLDLPQQLMPGDSVAEHHVLPARPNLTALLGQVSKNESRGQSPGDRVQRGKK